ncbi:cupin domain-containing protein [Mucilaginibacter sp.]|uniref:cupin domain-containing protein n=1 Tax=Mucilaginibacter sp. TaxID=1882438 RepID=UPI003D0FB241
MENINNTVTAIGANDGDSLSVAGGNYRILISGKQTGGAFAVIDMLIPPGSGPGPHAHAAFQESFFVVDGEVEVKSEAGTYVAKKGAFVSIPLGGMVHCFKNISAQAAHLLCTVVPSGLEEMFEELGKPVSPGVFLPPPPMDDATLNKMREIAEKYGQKLYPPNYFDK